MRLHSGGEGRSWSGTSRRRRWEKRAWRRACGTMGGVRERGGDLRVGGETRHVASDTQRPARNVVLSVNHTSNTIVGGCCMITPSSCTHQVERELIEIAFRLIPVRPAPICFLLQPGNRNMHSCQTGTQPEDTVAFNLSDHTPVKGIIDLSDHTHVKGIIDPRTQRYYVVLMGPVRSFHVPSHITVVI